GSGLLGPLREADFSFDDLGESDVGGPHARTGRNQRRTPAVQLADALGDHIDEHQRVADNLGSLLDEVAFHGCAWKPGMRLRLLEWNGIVLTHGGPTIPQPAVDGRTGERPYRSAPDKGKTPNVEIQSSLRPKYRSTDATPRKQTTVIAQLAKRAVAK